MILAADIWGTNTLIGLFELEGGHLRSLREATFPSEDFGALEKIVQRFF